MIVDDILKSKGHEVKSVGPEETIRGVTMRMHADSVGALVVVDPIKGNLLGIVSERDVARRVADYGSDLVSMRVSDIMTKSVITCGANDSVSAVSRIMVKNHIRHLPVVDHGALTGVISIGDVLNSRLEHSEH